MTLDEYQLAATRTRNPALDDREQLLDAAAGLAEEGGEALALVRKHWFQGRPLDRERLTTELGDALWCLATVASTLGVTLEEVARRNLEKLWDRYPTGFRQRGSAEAREQTED
jgi:NTP pyrophosphatase (non-canonical NTP hydrolase)